MSALISSLAFDEMATALSYAMNMPIAQVGSDAGVPSHESHEGGLSKKQQKKLKKQQQKEEQKKAQEEAKKDDEDDNDFDMGWDDDEEEEAEASSSQTMSRAERIKAAQDAKKKKNVGRTQVILDIKPSEIEVDLNQLWRDICATPINGVTWGEGFEIEPVAFGICKLVMSCVMVDDEVGMDDITEAIENTFEDLVQSVDVAAMNKV